MRALACMLLACVCLCVASTALLPVDAGVPAMEFALQDDAAFPGTLNIDMDSRTVSISAPNQDLALLRASQLGVQRIRTMLYIQHPCTPLVIREGHKARYTALVQKAVSQGFEVHLTLSGIAATWGRPIGWSTEKDASGNWIPYYCANATGVLPDLELWRSWVNESISYYSEMGVTRFTLWNEPNLAAFLCPVPVSIPPNGTIDDAKCIGATLEQQAALASSVWRVGLDVVRELRAAGRINDSIEVLVGDIAPLPNVKLFMEYQTNVTEADGWGLHPYQYCTPPESQLPVFIPNITTCQRLAGEGAGIAWAGDMQHRLAYLAEQGQLVARLPSASGSRALPLYLTEFGYMRTGASALPEDVRCDYLPRAMNVAAAAGARSMNVYQLFVSPPWVAWDSGIIDGAGNPLCSYTALQSWATEQGYNTKPLPALALEEESKQQAFEWTMPHGTVRGRPVYLGYTIVNAAGARE